MNKIKLIYDVVKTMKEKDIINGKLTGEGKKDQVQFVSFENEFQRNLITGDVKAKISSQLDFEGKKVKHESSTEFNLENGHGGIHHFHQHMHHHPNQGGKHHHNFKDKLSAVAFVLKMVNDMQIDEQADITLVSLNLSEIPEELKAIHEKRHQNMMEHHHQHPFPMKDFITMEKTNIAMTIQISKNKEIEKITLIVDGRHNDELNGTHEMNLKGELLFSW